MRGKASGFSIVVLALFAGACEPWIGPPPPAPPPRPLTVAVSDRIGERVRVEWGGKCYDARILAGRPGAYLITYEGYDHSWDETIGETRLCPGVPAVAAAPSGERVRVEWKGNCYDARILASRPGAYLITYEGYDHSWDETIDETRFCKPRAAPPGEPRR